MIGRNGDPHVGIIGARQERLVQPLQLHPGFDPELLDQQAPPGAVNLQCVGLPTEPVQCPHQQRAKAFP
jgi:hypothetical protein